MTETVLKIIKGDTTNITVTFTDVNGNPVNLTGSTVFFTVKENIDDSDTNAKIKKDVTIHTNPTQGITTIALSSTETNITPGTYWYDLQIKYSNNSVNSTEKGLLRVVQDVTTRTT